MASLSYVTVQNTGGHGIAVSNGTLSIGQGVTVTGAGTALKRRDGLNIAGGLVNIMVASGQAASTFNNNTQHGIYVTGAGVINITGFPVTVPAPNGQGTVVASGNAFAGLRIFEAPGAAALSTINGFVAWQNAQNGLRLYGGGKVKVRNSVFLANVLNGVYITVVRRDRGRQRSVADRSRLDLGRGTQRAAGGGRLHARPGRPVRRDVIRPRAADAVRARKRVRRPDPPGPTDCTTLDRGDRALDGVRRLRRPGRGSGGGHDRQRRRRDLPVVSRPAAETARPRHGFLAIRIPLP